MKADNTGLTHGAPNLFTSDPLGKLMLWPRARLQAENTAAEQAIQIKV
jgi:hypothetical protein